MNAFSPDYKPSAETLERIARDVREARAGRKNSESRAKRLQSPDPLVRLAAAGNLGPMSAPVGNPLLLKNSKLG